MENIYFDKLFFIYVYLSYDYYEIDFFLNFK